MQVDMDDWFEQYRLTLWHAVRHGHARAAVLKAISEESTL